MDGAWNDDAEIKSEIFVILGERPKDDVLKNYSPVIKKKLNL